LKEKVDIAASRIGIRVQAAAQAMGLGSSSKEAQAYPHLALKKANDHAAIAYVPKPYDGQVALIKSRGYFVGFADPAFGWRDVVKDGLEVHELPMSPKGMLIEPFCKMLADTLTQCLRGESKPDERTQHSGVALETHSARV
jgi:hypothetical protein